MTKKREVFLTYLSFTNPVFNRIKKIIIPRTDGDSRPGIILAKILPTIKQPIKTKKPIIRWMIDFISSIRM
jgi:hypothetical protein